LTRLHRPCGVLLWQAKPRPAPTPDIIPRLETLLARVRRIRANLYPADWTADPLYMVERELEDLLEELA